LGVGHDPRSRCDAMAMVARWAADPWPHPIPHPITDSPLPARAAAPVAGEPARRSPPWHARPALAAAPPERGGAPGCAGRRLHRARPQALAGSAARCRGQTRKAAPTGSCVCARCCGPCQRPRGLGPSNPRSVSSVDDQAVEDTFNVLDLIVDIDILGKVIHVIPEYSKSGANARMGGNVLKSVMPWRVHCTLLFSLVAPAAVQAVQTLPNFLARLR
jgi:hypothetical protein